MQARQDADSNVAEEVALSGSAKPAPKSEARMDKCKVKIAPRAEEADGSRCSELRSATSTDEYLAGDEVETRSSHGRCGHAGRASTTSCSMSSSTRRCGMEMRGPLSAPAATASSRAWAVACRSNAKEDRAVVRARSSPAGPTAVRCSLKTTRSCRGKAAEGGLLVNLSRRPL